MKKALVQYVSSGSELLTEELKAWSFGGISQGIV